MPIEYLTVAEALQLILASVDGLSHETVDLLEAHQRILAEKIVANQDMPPFANSSMDGYAIRAEDVSAATATMPVSLKVIADIPAGSISQRPIEAGTAARITTGAPLPAGADAVVPVEDTNERWREKRRLLPVAIDIRRSVEAGDFVRWPGEDVSAGTEILHPGKRLRSQEIGLLASLGYSKVCVVRRPKVGILSTGDELVEINDPLGPGKIRNSNGFALAVQVTEANGVPIQLGIARDSATHVRQRLVEGTRDGLDLLISSAGVSVGAYDVVKNVLEQDGDVGFWRVRMRPGKPLAFGRYNNVPFLGLPGNPVSAMVSFERFARPAILKMAGWSNLERPTILARLDEAIESDGRESYIRAIVRRDASGYRAQTTGGQGSHMITSMVMANALLVVPEGVTSVESGSSLTAMMLDWPSTVF